jgi:hypothetical protein
MAIKPNEAMGIVASVIGGLLSQGANVDKLRSDLLDIVGDELLWKRMSALNGLVSLANNRDDGDILNIAVAPPAKRPSSSHSPEHMAMMRERMAAKRAKEAAERQEREDFETWKREHAERKA